MTVCELYDETKDADHNCGLDGGQCPFGGDSDLCGELK